MKKILLITDAGDGADGWYHVGDEATFYSLYKRIQKKYPKNEIYLWSRLIPRNVSVPRSSVFYFKSFFKRRGRLFYFILVRLLFRLKLKQLLKIILPGFEKVYKTVSLVDYIVVCGGGNLNSLFPKYVFNRALFVILARYIGKKIYFAPQTIGRFSNISDFILMRYILRKSDFIQVREPISPLLSFGVKRKVKQVFDDALRLNIVLDNNYGVSLIGTKVALSMRDFDSLKNIECIEYAILKIKQKNKNIIFYLLPHIFDNNNNNGDLIIMKKVMKKTNTSYVLIDSKYFSKYSTKRPEEILLGLVKQMNFVLTSRYHGAIFGLHQSVPTICFFDTDYYEKKFIGIKTLLDKYKTKGFYFIDTRTFDFRLFNAVFKKGNNLEEKKDKINKDVFNNDLLKWVKEGCSETPSFTRSQYLND